jgi:hypothetical protein
MSARALILASLALAAAPAALADPAAVRRTWLERVAISAADQSCNLFSEGERLALRSGLYQAEGELLRANQSRVEMDRLSAEVSARARSLGCGHPDVVSVAATVRNAYRQFAKESYFEYPAAHAVWGASRSEHDRWSVRQTDKDSGLIFGLRRVPGKPDESRLAIAMPARGATPASAQLVFRDNDKMPEPWFGALNGKSAKLAAAPRATAYIAWASKVMSGKDEVGDPIWIFTFDAATIAALELLDPREAVQVNLNPAPRAKDQKVRQVTFEIGDFRAARAFSQIPKADFATTQAEAPAAAPAAGGH